MGTNSSSRKPETALSCSPRDVFSTWDVPPATLRSSCPARSPTRFLPSSNSTGRRTLESTNAERSTFFQEPRREGRQASPSFPWCQAPPPHQGTIRLRWYPNRRSFQARYLPLLSKRLLYI